MTGGILVRTLKAIDLVLENCEVITIAADNIELFYANNIERSISFRDGTYNETISAKEIGILISTAANVDAAYTDRWKENRPLPFDRLTKFNDISHFDVHYQDGSNKYIQVHWDGDLDDNPCQTSKIDSEGLHIIIKPEE